MNQHFKVLLFSFIALSTFSCRTRSVSSLFGGGTAETYPLTGTYRGYILMDRATQKIPVVMSTFFEPDEDNDKVTTMHAFLRMAFGGFSSHEYITHHYINADWNISSTVFRLNATSAGTRKDLSVRDGTISPDGKKITGRVTARSAGDLEGSLVLIHESVSDFQTEYGRNAPEIPDIDMITGTYIGTCDETDEAMLQIEAARASTYPIETGAFAEYYFSGRLAYNNRQIRINGENMVGYSVRRQEVLDHLMRYNFYRETLEIAHPQLGSCKVTHDGLECKNCKFKRQNLAPIRKQLIAEAGEIRKQEPVDVEKYRDYLVNFGKKISISPPMPLPYAFRVDALKYLKDNAPEKYLDRLDEYYSWLVMATFGVSDYLKDSLKDTTPNPRVITRFDSEDPITSKSDNSDLDGSFQGFIHNELQNVDRHVTAQLVVDGGSVVRPNDAKQIYINAQFYSGGDTPKTSNPLFVTFVSQPYTVKEKTQEGDVIQGQMELSIKIEKWSKNYLAGTVYGKSFGRIGILELIRKDKIKDDINFISGTKSFERVVSKSMYFPDFTKLYVDVFSAGLNHYDQAVVKNVQEAILFGRKDRVKLTFGLTRGSGDGSNISFPYGIVGQSEDFYEHFTVGSNGFNSIIKPSTRGFFDPYTGVVSIGFQDSGMFIGRMLGAHTIGYYLAPFGLYVQTVNPTQNVTTFDVQ